MNRRSFFSALGVAPFTIAVAIQRTGAEPANVTMAAEWERRITGTGIVSGAFGRPMVSQPILDFYATETLEDEWERRITGREGRFTMRAYEDWEIRSELNWRGIIVD